MTGHAAQSVDDTMQQAGQGGGGGGGGGGETGQTMSTYPWAESSHYSTPVKQMEGESASPVKLKGVSLPGEFFI